MRRFAWTLIALAAACSRPPAGKDKAPPAAQPAAAAQATEDTVEMDAQYLQDLAMVHQRHRGYDRARELLELALARSESAADKARIQMRIGEVLQAAGDTDAAMNAYRNAAEGLDDVEERTRVQLRLGQQYRRTNELDKAEAALHDAYQHAGQSHVRDAARSELLQVWKAQGTLDAKIAEYESKLAGAPDDLEAMRILSVAYGQAGKPDKSIPLLKKLAQREPDQTAHLQHLGNFSFQAGLHAEGIAAFQKLAEKAPHSRAQAYERIASGYASLGQNDKALEYARKIGEIASERTPYLYVQQGNLYGRLERQAEAVQSFQKAIDQASSPQQREDFRFQLANFYVGQKRLEEAAQILDELASGPGSDRLRDNAKRLSESVRGQLARQ